MSIGENQIKIINEAKSFLEKVDFSKIDSTLSSFCYFNSWAETPGYARLKLKNQGSSFFINFFKILFKNILSIASHTKYIEINNKNSLKKYESMILSWSFKKNFLPDGSFQDRYFNQNSNNLAKSFWILISMDGYVPSNLNDNIKIIKRKKGFFKYNFFSLIKILISTVVSCNFSVKKIYHSIFFHSYFAKLINKIIIKDIKENNFKSILLPYEAQPFQNNLFYKIKKINKKIINIGYLHSLSPLTCELIYRTGSPDLLLVHGNSQIKMLETKLNWPKQKLFLIQSLRFNKNKSLSKKIFIPMAIHNFDIFLKEFKQLLEDSPKNYFPKFIIQNHPTMSNSKKHNILKKELEKLMEIYKDRFSENSNNENISIFFGVTAAILEALEKKINVIHICSDPIFQSYSEQLWPNFKVKQLSKFTFNYNLNLSGKLINFGKNNTLNEVLKTIF